MDTLLLPDWTPTALEDLQRPPAWHADAACKDTPDPDAFYRGRNNYALNLCRRCPVRRQCREQAVAMRPEDDFGLWGGSNRSERQEIRQRRAAAV